MSQGKAFVTFIYMYLRHHLVKPFCRVHYEWFDLLDNQKILIVAPRGLAKAQSLDSKVLTPHGWKLMRDIHGGDEVIGADGKVKEVFGETQEQLMDLYRISTRDGRSTLCNLGHLWGVTIPSNTGDRHRVETLQTILSNYKSARFDKRNGCEYTEYRYFLDWSDPIEFTEKVLPIDPYTLGAWLGDGTSSSGQITTDDPEMLSYFPFKCRKNQSKYRYGILGLNKPLRLNGLLQNKHIPEIYLYGSVEQRTRLLQGLMDTDGTVEVGGHIASFCNTNKGLIDDFTALARSLGATVHIGEGVTKLNGKEFRYWKAQCRFPDSVIPFRLIRKVKKWNGSIKTKSAIVDIKFEKRDLGKCLHVEDDYYITDDFMVTHNSTIISFFYALFLILEQKKEVVFVSSSQRIAERFMSKVIRELETNPLILKHFGPQKGTKWTNDWIKLKDGGELQCIGSEGKIRGMRPGVLLVDDIENDENVRSEDYRKKLKHKFLKEWSYLMKPYGQILVIGTLLHPLSLLSEMLEQLPGSGFSDFVARKYAMLVNDRGEPDINGKSIWEQQWPTELLHKERDTCLEAFEQERMNNPLPDELRKFSEADIIYYDKLPMQVGYTMTIDPAIDIEADKDYTAFVVVATAEDGTMFVVEAYRKRLEPGEVVDKMFQLNSIYKPHVIGVENVAISKLYRKYFELESKRRNEYLNIMPMKLDMSRSGRSKQYRIEALRPFFKQGRIRVLKDQIDLKGELLSFPTGKHDDLIDALALQLNLIKPEKSASAKPVPGSFGEFWTKRKESKRGVRFHKWVEARHRRLQNS